MKECAKQTECRSLIQRNWAPYQLVEAQNPIKLRVSHGSVMGQSWVGWEVGRFTIQLSYDQPAEFFFSWLHGWMDG